MSHSKAEEISDILRDEILRGQYRAGERLPSERDLSARFEANRGAIREAIKKLEQLGIADVQPGGVRIVPIKDATLEVIGHLMDLDEIPRPILVAQLFEVFGAMMSLSARSAIEIANESQITDMRKIVTKLTENIDSPEDYHNGWRELSIMFTEINDNLILRLMSNGLKTQFVGRLERMGLSPVINKEGDKIFLKLIDEAIQKRDPQKASNAIIGRFDLLKTSFLEALTNEEASGTRSASNA
jgi:DNA-binding FadR family transcriptional regulator